MDKDSLKVLKDITSEPNEFKRYNLLMMWTQQFFTSTIIDPIKLHENRLKDISQLTNTTAEVQSLYDVLRAVKTSLTIKNEELLKVLDKMKMNMNIIKVLNQALELKQDDVQDEYVNNVKKLEKLISTNTTYIQHIGNLSESKIQSIINDDSNQ